MLHCFDAILLVNIPLDYLDKAAQFAARVVSTVNYRDSNQSISAKIQEDHKISKLGEEAVRLVWEHFGFEVRGPDYEIYEGRKKSWEADLFINQIPLAVKTQSRASAERYKTSWTFQSSGVRHDPILDKPKDWVVFTVVEPQTTGIKAWVFPAFQIQELSFSEPKLAHLKGKKRVVYARDLPLNDTKPIWLSA